MSNLTNRSPHDVPPFLMPESVNRKELRWVFLGLAVLFLALMYNYRYPNSVTTPAPRDLAKDNVLVLDNRVLCLVMVTGFVILGWMMYRVIGPGVQPRIPRYSLLGALVVWKMLPNRIYLKIIFRNLVIFIVLWTVITYLMKWDENKIDKMLGPYIYQ